MWGKSSAYQASDDGIGKSVIRRRRQNRKEEIAFQLANVDPIAEIERSSLISALLT